MDSSAKTASIIARGTTRIASAPSAPIADDSSKGKWSPLWGRRTTAAASLAPVAGHCRFSLFVLFLLPNQKFLFFLFCLETHKSNFGWMPSGSLTGRNTLLDLDIISLVLTLPQLRFSYILFLREAVKRKWSTVPNCLSANFLLPKKSPTAFFFLAILRDARCVAVNMQSGKSIDWKKFHAGCCFYGFPYFLFFFFFSYKFQKGRNMDRIDSGGGPGKWDENLDK